ncbi:hypothetical protein ACLEIY_01910 [Acetobacter tropicalis]|uniref:hypothetical protein n=1 Tax=Acetobacter tropicalis TaxID=104102 RepID=UPI0039757A67
MVDDPIERLSKRVASLQRKVSVLEAETLAARQLLLTFVTNRMPEKMTDEQFTKMLDTFCKHAEDTMVDPEDREKDSMEAAIKHLRRELMDAWIAQRWNAHKRKKYYEE